MAVALPKWYTEQTQTKRRRSPFLIIGLILAAALLLKLGFYAHGLFPSAELGPPLPVVQTDDASGPHHKISSHGGKKGGHRNKHPHKQEDVDDDDDDDDVVVDVDEEDDHDDVVDEEEDDDDGGDNNGDNDSHNDDNDDLDDSDDTNDHNDDHPHSTIIPAVIPTGRPMRKRPQINEWYTFKTEAFTGPNISFVHNGTTAPGYFFVAPRSLVHRMSAPMILDESGDLVWRGPTGESTNMKVQTLNGKQYITYWRSMRQWIIGHEYGSAHILNSSYDEVYTICPKDMDIVTNDMREYPCNLDMHVLTLTDRGTILATAYNITTADLRDANGTKSDYVYESQFYEIDIETQEIKYTWKSLDHKDQLPVGSSKLPNRHRPAHDKSIRSHPYDYFHINAVEVLDDGYLVNSRNMWNIFKVNKTGDVEWRLNGEDGGDFTLDSNLYFSWQHDARVINRTDKGLYISLFNNDFSFTESAVNVSDALTIYVDLENKHAKVIRTLVDEVEHIYSLAMGNNQQLPNGHVFVNYGFGGTFKEYNEKNEVVMTGHFGRGSSKSFYSSYNMYRIDGWHGQPRTPPKVYAEYVDKTDQTTVWMSWNGATDYDNWQVYAAHDWAKLKPMAKDVKRTGFETRTVLDGRLEWVQAEARKGSASLGNSTAVETYIWQPPAEDDYDNYYYYDDPHVLPPSNKTNDQEAAPTYTESADGSKSNKSTKTKGSKSQATQNLG